MFNLIEQLFSPGRRHSEDERQRLAHTRFDAGADGAGGSTDPGTGPIDLASGRVTVRPPQRRKG